MRLIKKIEKYSAETTRKDALLFCLRQELEDIYTSEEVEIFIDLLTAELANELTCRQREVLQGLHRAGFNWITRDFEGDIQAWHKQPYGGDRWDNTNEYGAIIPNKEIFKNLSKDKAHNIEKMLKGERE